MKRILSLVLGLFAFVLAADDNGATSQTAKLPNVVAAPVELRMFTAYVTEIGIVKAEESVSLSARVKGTLLKVNFQEGELVKKDAVLFEIDPAEYLANLKKAEARMKALEAEKQRNQAEFDRNAELLKTNAVSQRDYQRAEANLRETEANIISAGAEIDLARLDVSYTKITAPFDGYMGFKNYSAGNLVSPESGELASIEMSGSAKVVFNIAETDLVRLLENATAAGSKPTDAKIELLKQDGSKIDLEGRLMAWDNKINQKTGTLKLEALFKDPKRYMIPGLYVKVRLYVGRDEKLAALRKDAVSFDVTGTSVMVIKDAANGSGVVERRFIKPYSSDDINIYVRDGVSAGELLIVAGMQKVRPGAQCAYTLEGRGK